MRFLIPWLFVFLILNVNLFSREIDEKNLIENFDLYNSTLDWTRGILKVELSSVYSPDTENIGKFYDKIRNEMRDELKSKIVKAFSLIKVSGSYYIKDYYNSSLEKRYEILDFTEEAIFNPLLKGKADYKANAILKLYGEKSIVDIFFKNLRTIEPTNYIDETKNLEYYDTLVIDLTPFPDFSPSIAPRIYDENGLLVFGPETVNYEVFKKEGLCIYTRNLSYAFSSPRTGKRVFYTIPKMLKGELKTDIVIFNEDAKKLLANRRTLNYLKDCDVIIVKP